MKEDNLPVPEKWDAEITDSIISPFSDKLMMFHAAFLVNAALSYYGAALDQVFVLILLSIIKKYSTTQ
ncbi:DUF3231 family protein [Caldibacillus lycopersici]|uniref:DUF3231 family protein n=1 Tax=Perspicuibacillus lycopersici TaxID=1325689 RepID=A0AAE3IQP6_9BACI|nr:DUF3231 family protein [Perspicuibacillus lycopersici]MCU9612667.1 DUF3231 family protein [Perspicuibacillus lycopersici]